MSQSTYRLTSQSESHPSNSSTLFRCGSLAFLFLKSIELSISLAIVLAYDLKLCFELFYNFFLVDACFGGTIVFGGFILTKEYFEFHV